MDNNKNYTACKLKVDKDNHLKGSTVCKSCYNEKRRTKHQ